MPKINDRKLDVAVTNSRASGSSLSNESEAFELFVCSFTNFSLNRRTLSINRSINKYN